MEAFQFFITSLPKLECSEDLLLLYTPPARKEANKKLCFLSYFTQSKKS